MTPSDFSRALKLVNERLQSVYTGGLALVAFAVVALAAAYGLNAIQQGFADTAAGLAAAGAGGAIAAARVLVWRRDDICDDILLSGYRHVGGPLVERRAAELVSSLRRVQLANTLDRFVDAAVDHRPTAVPLHRPAVRQLEPQIRQLAAALREPDRPVPPSGMVLVRRLVTDGAESPLFQPTSGPRNLERALERIRAELRAEALGDDLSLAA
jgi:hypothetical protein